MTQFIGCCGNQIHPKGLELCPARGHHSVNVKLLFSIIIIIIIASSPFGIILLGCSHLQTVSLDLTLRSHGHVTTCASSEVMQCLSLAQEGE